jgi:L-threonylcarbamoyladenylate synthase
LGVRLPAHPVARALVSAAGRPISGTSANRSGHPGFSSCPAADSFIGRQVDMALDAGALEGGVGSTVIDCTKPRPSIIREGVVPAQALLDLL